jgi:hypothetical protein
MGDASSTRGFMKNRVIVLGLSAIILCNASCAGPEPRSDPPQPARVWEKTAPLDTGKAIAAIKLNKLSHEEQLAVINEWVSQPLSRTSKTPTYEGLDEVYIKLRGEEGALNTDDTQIAWEARALSLRSPALFGASEVLQEIAVATAARNNGDIPSKEQLIDLGRDTRKALLGLILEVEERRLGNYPTIEVASLAIEENRLEFLEHFQRSNHKGPADLSDFVELIGRLVVEERDIDYHASNVDREFVRIDAINRMAAAAKIVVYIDLGPSGIGTGFLYNGKVLTCAHLFKDDLESPEKLLNGIKAYFVNDDCTAFDKSREITFSSARFFPDFDLAELSPDEQSVKIITRHDIGPGVEYCTDIGSARAGVVYLAGTYIDRNMPSEPIPAWSRPARIVYPALLDVPPATWPPGTESRAQVEDLFLSAVIYETARRFAPGTPVGDYREHFVSAWNAVASRYRHGGDDNVYYFFLPEDSKPLWKMKGASEAFIASKITWSCGTELASNPGMSGAPVLDFGADRVRVIGMNRAKGHSAPGTVGVRGTGLKECEYMTPFAFIHKALE